LTVLLNSFSLENGWYRTSCKSKGHRSRHIDAGLNVAWSLGLFYIEVIRSGLRVSFVYDAEYFIFCAEIREFV